ncbi:MAG: hypothetical protein NTX46_02300 [Chloroflexi bacterium]|nr:hypothetical protein [Chloroflexota bacterium]
MSLKKAILRSFDSDSYAATIEIAGSHKIYLEGVVVARNLPIVEMTVGMKLVAAFFDEYNTKDAVVIAVYT